MTLQESLQISWHDSAWIPILNQSNALDYFCQRTNPFYDSKCNNEVVKMQRLTSQHLVEMTGIEYTLVHVLDPILYIIRKLDRKSPQQTITLCNYYIIAGVVYQAPDLASVINSRLTNCITNLHTAFLQTQSYSRYHPSKGYWWQFSDGTTSGDNKSVSNDVIGSVFQRTNVNRLLGNLVTKFPAPVVDQLPPSKTQQEVAECVPEMLPSTLMPQQQQQQQMPNTNNSAGDVKKIKLG